MLRRGSLVQPQKHLIVPGDEEGDTGSIGGRPG